MRVIISSLGLLLASNAFAAFEYGQHTFDTDGYLRIGAGASEDGGPQAQFQAPSARSKYRLGNEPDANLELAVSHRYRMEPELKSPTVHTYVMIDGYAAHNDDFEFNNLAQAYVEFEQFFDNDISVWMGRRYYDRKDIHLSDHFWLNTGQGAYFGMGLEGFKLGSGEVSLAAFRYQDKGAQSVNASATGVLNSTAFDLRYHGFELTDNHTLNLWGQLVQRHENDDLDYRNKMGFGGGGWIDSKNFLGGEHTLAVLFLGGPAITKGDFDARPVREDENNDGQNDWDLGEATAVEINSNYTVEIGKRFAFQSMLLYRYEVRGVDDGIKGDEVFWWSAGGRLVYFMSDYFSLAGEAGFDTTDNQLVDLTGSVRKATLALQMAPKPGYYERPLMRLFITLANWDNDFEGIVASDVYGEDTAGFTVGAQVETWW